MSHEYLSGYTAMEIVGVKGPYRQETNMLCPELECPRNSNPLLGPGLLGPALGLLWVFAGCWMENEASSTATKRFATGFEDMASVVGTPGFEWSVKNQVDGLGVKFYVWGPASTQIWIEPTQQNHGIPPHSGSKFLGGKTAAGGSRLEILLINDPSRGYSDLARLGLQEQFYLSVWMYLPGDWKMYSSDWYMPLQITGKSRSPWAPYVGIMLMDAYRDGVSPVTVQFYRRDSNANAHYSDTHTNFALPRGRWFRIEWFQTWSDTAARVCCKIDGQLLWDHNGSYFCERHRATETLTTLFQGGATFMMEIGKIYHYDTTGEHYCYWDDLEIWDGLPTE
jgi:hypothetical protein